MLVLREQSDLGGAVMDVLSFTSLKASHLCQLRVRFYRPDDTPLFFQVEMLFLMINVCSATVS